MTRRSACTSLTLTAMLGAVTACGGDAAADGFRAEVRDSAGIRLVENVATAEAAPVLRLSEQPVVRIGALEGAPEYLLNRVQGATRLSDGTIVVANNGSSELRYYDRSGRHFALSGDDRARAGHGDIRGRAGRHEYV